MNKIQKQLALVKKSILHCQYQIKRLNFNPTLTQAYRELLEIRYAERTKLIAQL